MLSERSIRIKRKRLQMKLDEIKLLSFPEYSLEDWKKAAESSLKGKTIDKLRTNTYEGIELEPLYTAESLPEGNGGQEFPGFSPYTRGIDVTGYREKPWLICQPVYGTSAEDANQNMQTALARGQNAICFPAAMLGDSPEKLLQDLPLHEVPVFIDLAGDGVSSLPLVIESLKKLKFEGQLVKGVLAEDPVAEWAASGNVPTDIDKYFKSWFSGIRRAKEDCPGVKTILVKASNYHNGGANAVQELAYGLAEAVFYLDEGQKNGLSLEELTEKIVFSFAIDSNYFMNIAKLRAARRLWALISEAYGVSSDYFKMHIHAVTSGITETLYDKHVNILRTANQAFAAAVGGIQYLQIHPFDRLNGKRNEFSERLARNTQLILREESHVPAVTDPAGGSFYVEKLTDDITEAVWDKFLKIARQGGILDALKKGAIQSEVASVFIQMQKNAAYRKQSIIGTNVYPNPAENGQQFVKGMENQHESKTDFVEIVPIPTRRVAEDFEHIRLRAEAHAAGSGAAPKLGLVNIGELKAYKQRADFIKGLAAAGGIGTVDTQGCSTLEDVRAFVAETNLKTYCICGSDSDYAEQAKSIAIAAIECLPGVNIYLAGKQGAELEDALKQAGVKGFIHVKTNAVEILSQLLTELEVN
ncbi:methylmalonyl-CoA mutase subunit beta [Peribacillus glennii]|uniref:Methylmalonyl-CoA mutase n=1 Tax=Peribacillus glennii TaxID=2303991 RepID=A0A372LH55_9BACI|nr:methylmalonyl-CoA mutase subunit beta [Peribacillus glennii]RFU65635.1 methylmalonyl-CoA mutase [Peribacillus glennii]